MSLGRVLLDSAVFIYAIGGGHRYREPCIRLLEGLRDREYLGETTVLAIQEVLHQRARRTGQRAEAARLARDLTAVARAHDATVSDLRLAVRLFADGSNLDAADAFHAAIALNRDIGTVVSPDPAFDEVTGLARLDPLAAAARLGNPT